MTTYTVSDDVFVPMRDGTRLATTVLRPDGGEKVPALLIRTPYGKTWQDLAYTTIVPPLALVEAGFAVVIQLNRGMFGSEGTFTPFVDDAADGEDAVRWLCEQPWCDGNVGTFGSSYLGFTQWHTASTGVKGLGAMAPMLASGDLYRAPMYSPGGAMSLSTQLGWSYYQAMNVLRSDPELDVEKARDLGALGAALGDVDALAWHTPVGDHPLLDRYLPRIVDLALRRPERDETWQALSRIDQAAEIMVPALSTAGWYDPFMSENLRAYTVMKAQGGSVEAREGQRLIIGPWTHADYSGVFPSRDFGVAADLQAAGVAGDHLAFFDRWLRGRADALDGKAPVRVFVMGLDQWRDEADWPLPDTRYVPYFLDGAGPANTAEGAGRLTAADPAHEAADTYLYDPRRPVPTLGGTTIQTRGFRGGPMDQRPVHGRDDVLCFSTEVLDEPLEVTGPVSATLFVSSSAADTDFTAKLVDVHPDGRAIILCDGIQRMRYRHSLSRPETMSSGEVYEITIDMTATSNVFLPGHRILLEVSSSNFPRYDRNSNTGGVLHEERESDMIVAVNHVHRGPEHPSRLILPVISR
ncbi:CocE/NonD family hydrolase [Streptomyces sp. NPDC057199]|uniref:CocE/NonD family hydrolase n=1 Tax=Streptomyces sp. NPDC057199 TaxID=3346047 RepID=UPI0036309753